MIRAYGFAIPQAGKDVIQKMAKNVMGMDIDVIDVKYHKVVGLASSDLVWLFGEQAKKIVLPMVVTNSIVNYLALPEVSLLIPPGDAPTRARVFEELKTFKDNLSSPVEKQVVVTREALSNLNVKAIQEIATRKREWTGVLEDGRKIRLSDELPPDNRYDINMKFSELVSLKLAMEKFNVKEFHLVTSKESNSSISDANSNS